MIVINCSLGLCSSGPTSMSQKIMARYRHPLAFSAWQGQDGISRIPTMQSPSPKHTQGWEAACSLNHPPLTTGNTNMCLYLQPHTGCLLLRPHTRFHSAQAPTIHPPSPLHANTHSGGKLSALAALHPSLALQSYIPPRPCMQSHPCV